MQNYYYSLLLCLFWCFDTNGCMSGTASGLKKSCSIKSKGSTLRDPWTALNVTQRR